MLGMKLHNTPNEQHLLHCGLLSSHYEYMRISLIGSQCKYNWVALGTLSFRSLQFRQPYLDRRRVLRFRTSVVQVEAMADNGCSVHMPA